MSNSSSELFKLSENNPDLALILETCAQAEAIYSAAMAAMGQQVGAIPSVKNSADIMLTFEPGNHAGKTNRQQKSLRK